MLVGEFQKFPNGIYYDQYRIGGTSVASPLMAGVIARADQASGGPLGFLNPELYSLYGQTGAIYDVQAAGAQDVTRPDFVYRGTPHDGILYSTRITARTQARLLRRTLEVNQLGTEQRTWRCHRGFWVGPDV